MRKLSLTGMLLLMISTSAISGDYLTNTNQHISFLRMIARGASIGTDGVYCNPAGLVFLDDGIHLSFNWQSAYQTRTIDATFPLFPEGTRHYKGTASVPFIPSLQFAYKRGNWAISGSFAVTGGGGKASFDQGLPMFDAGVIAGLAPHSVTTDMYSINSSMTGEQSIFGIQLGAGYKVTDYLSLFGGGRMNIVSSGYVGFLTTTAKPGYESLAPMLPQIELDCDQSGWGVTPIIGANLKYDKWLLGVKYELKTNLNIENRTKKNSDPDGTLKDFKDGGATPNDIPSLVSVALGYNILPTLRATVEYHHFFDKQAGMAGGKEKSLTGGTNEYLVGTEWDITKRVTVSAGYQKTDYGLSDDFQSDLSFYCDSYSVGFGGEVKLSPKLNLNIAYFWSTYSDYVKNMEKSYGGRFPEVSNVYGRTNKVFGLGVNIRL